MSRRLHEAPLAVTMDGTLLVSVAYFETKKNPEELIRRALEQRGDFFIGVAMSEWEMNQTLRRLDDAAAEAVARVIAKRRGRRGLSGQEKKRRKM
jgi:hypothetical protein